MANDGLRLSVSLKDAYAHAHGCLAVAHELDLIKTGAVPYLPAEEATHHQQTAAPAAGSAAPSADAKGADAADAEWDGPALTGTLELEGRSKPVVFSLSGRTLRYYATEKQMHGSEQPLGELRLQRVHGGARNARVRARATADTPRVRLASDAARATPRPAPTPQVPATSCCTGRAGERSRAGAGPARPLSSWPLPSSPAGRTRRSVPARGSTSLAPRAEAEPAGARCLQSAPRRRRQLRLPNARPRERRAPRLSRRLRHTARRQCPRLLRPWASRPRPLWRSPSRCARRTSPSSAAGDSSSRGNEMSVRYSQPHSITGSLWPHGPTRQSGFGSPKSVTQSPVQSLTPSLAMPAMPPAYRVSYSIVAVNNVVVIS